MKPGKWIGIITGLLLLAGCAVPGQKFIDIRPGQTPEKGCGSRIAVLDFEDARPETGPGYVGYRILMDRSRERYFVNGLDLAAALAEAARRYLDQKGCVMVSGDEAASGDRVLTARIDRFECRARKDFPATKMILEIELVFFLENRAERRRTRIPVALTLERTEVGFSEKKLQTFVNQSLFAIHEKLPAF